MSRRFRVSILLTQTAVATGILSLVSSSSFAQPLAPAFGQFGKPAAVKVSTYWSATGIRAGGQITLAVVLEITKPYHINSHKAIAPFVPTTVEFADGPDFLRSSTAVFPMVKSIAASSGEKLEGFSGRTVVYMPFAAAGSAGPGRKTINIRIGYQACDDKKCLLPSQITRSVELNFLGAPEKPQATNAELFKDLDTLRDRLNIPLFGLDFQIAPSRLWLLLFIAAAGGCLLNATPCVLPLVPIKMMSLSQAANNRRRCFLLGTAMSLGVVTFWMAMGIAISTISGFNATNKLFQYPLFTLTVGVIICLMAVGMSGFFTIRLPQWAYAANPSQTSVVGSFLFGIITAVLSTPCTAPFMGAAAAWAATQSPVIALSTFGAIGVGMALPYLLLSAFPNLVSRVPRTGPASELVKQVMGLLMMAAGAYFLGTGLAGILAEPPDPPTQGYWWIVVLFIAAAGFWLSWRTLRISSRTMNRLVFGSAGLAMMVLAVAAGLRFTERSPVHWIYFTPERFAAAQKQAKVTVLEFTAAWCLNCHALEQAVLHDPQVVKLLNSEQVIPIKVDLTGNNPAGNHKLIEAGRRSIPYLVIYSPQGRQVFESDAYTVRQIADEIKKLLR